MERIRFAFLTAAASLRPVSIALAQAAESSAAILAAKW
jgi:hypothetical protein